MAPSCRVNGKRPSAPRYLRLPVDLRLYFTSYPRKMRGTSHALGPVTTAAAEDVERVVECSPAVPAPA